MWLMFPDPDDDADEPAILVVDDEGAPRCIASSVEDAISWLGSIGIVEVGVPVHDGTEMFKIEPAGDSTLAHQDLWLRRALLGVPPGLCPCAAGDACPFPPAGAVNRQARRKADAADRRRHKLRSGAAR